MDNETLQDLKLTESGHVKLGSMFDRAYLQKENDSSFICLEQGNRLTILYLKPVLNIPDDFDDADTCVQDNLASVVGFRFKRRCYLDMLGSEPLIV